VLRVNELMQLKLNCRGCLALNVDFVVLCMYVDLGKMSLEFRMKNRGCLAQTDNISTGFGGYT